jgi:hypothetical protein
MMDGRGKIGGSPAGISTFHIEFVSRMKIC